MANRNRVSELLAAFETIQPFFLGEYPYDSRHNQLIRESISMKSPKAYACIEELKTNLSLAWPYFAKDHHYDHPDCYKVRKALSEDW